MVMYQIVKTMHHIYIYICVCVCVSVYLPVKLTDEFPWNSRHFMWWKIAHPWWGSSPRSLDYILSSLNSCHVSDPQAMHSTYISIYQGIQTKKNEYENDKKYELKMSDGRHFEFYDLWENGVTYSLAYGRNGFSRKNSYRINKWSSFPQKCLQVFI